MQVYIDGENMIIDKYHKSCVISGSSNRLRKISAKRIFEKCTRLVEIND